MGWNWQQPDWPAFTFNPAGLEPLERRFLLHSGEFIGAFKHFSQDDRDMLKIEMISDEALKTSEIEGEILNRDSVQSSLRRQFGLAGDKRQVPPAEQGIARMMVNLYETFADPLTHQTTFAWHDMIMSERKDIRVIGGYRTHTEPMQVVSGSIHDPKVHFEAPPSQSMTVEMDAFVAWFNRTAPGGSHPTPYLTRPRMAHLYFVSIHPFEDGNGRIGRAVAEKSLAQSLGQPTLIALAFTIERARKAYYDMLERSNKNNEITAWLTYFAETVLEAQANTLRRLEFYLAKARLYDTLRGELNERQEKALARMFREGIDGFEGGLSAENYVSITKATRATATRDLRGLVKKGALLRTGQLKHTRYHLNIPERGR